MKANTLIFLIILLGTFGANGQKCIISFNTNLCDNCYKYYQYLEKIPFELDLEIHMPLMNEKVARKIIAQKLNLGRKDYKIILNDSVFYKRHLNNKTSEISFIGKDGKTELNTTIEDYVANYPIYNSLVLSKPLGSGKPIDINDAEYSNNVAVKSNEHYALIHDIPLARVLRINRLTNQIDTITPTQFDVKELYLKVYKDSSYYREISELGKTMNGLDMNKLKLPAINIMLHSAVLYGEDVYLFLWLPYLDKEKSSPTSFGIRKKSCLVRVTPNLEIQTYPIRLQADNTYFLYGFFGINEKGAYLEVAKTSITTDNRVLAHYIYNQGELQFNEFLDFNLPKVYIDNNIDYNFIKVDMVKHYCFLPLSNEFYSINLNKTMNLPFELNNDTVIYDGSALEANYRYSCSTIQGNLLFLVSFNALTNTYNYLICDLETKSIRLSVPISIQTRTIAPYYDFTLSDFNKLLIVTPNHIYEQTISLFQ